MVEPAGNTQTCWVDFWNEIKVIIKLMTIKPIPIILEMILPFDLFNADSP